MVDKPVNRVQVAWAIALILMGLMVFYRTYTVMPDLEQLSGVGGPGFLRFSFYLLGALLIAGGVQKLFRQYRRHGDPKSRGRR